MGDDEDDYLSDKFLVETASRDAPKTYTDLRKEVRKRSQLKNEQNRGKSRRQREIEAREEGLSKSLFERAKEEEEAGLGTGNKALAMMMKMGFKPGESLGRTAPSAETTADEEEKTPNDGPRSGTHKTEPLPVQEWLGKSGIGVAKRARSPSAHERLAKMAKMEEEAGHRTFRDRARQEYEERRAEGRLVPAQRTCNTLDEKAGKTLNVLWLNPNQPDTLPPGLMEALARHHEQYILASGRSGETEEERLRRQMRADALTTASPHPEAGSDDDDDDDDTGDASTAKEKRKLVELNQQYDPDFLEEAVQFLRLQPQDRLYLVVSYLRTEYAYCFWCGTEYQDQTEMTEQCPGPEEDDHD